MGKLVYSMMTTLDGFVAGPDNDLSWALIDEDIHTFVNEREQSVPITLYGRRMYEMMSYWETADSLPNRPQYENEFARLWKQQRKIVFSTSLQDVAGNASIERRVDFDRIRRLKADTDGDLSASGPTLASQFINEGLVDEYMLYQHPVVIGEGTPFFLGIQRRIGSSSSNSTGSSRASYFSATHRARETDHEQSSAGIFDVAGRLCRRAGGFCRAADGWRR